jgi:hypothetical protein
METLRLFVNGQAAPTSIAAYLSALYHRIDIQAPTKALLTALAYGCDAGRTWRGHRTLSEIADTSGLERSDVEPLLDRLAAAGVLLIDVKTPDGILYRLDPERVVAETELDLWSRAALDRWPAIVKDRPDLAYVVEVIRRKVQKARQRQLEERADDVVRLWDAWRLDDWYCGSPGRARLDFKRLEKISDRLADSTVDELLVSLRGAKHARAQMETLEYRDIVTIWRDRAQVEKFCQLAERQQGAGVAPPVKGARHTLDQPDARQQPRRPSETVDTFRARMQRLGVRDDDLDFRRGLAELEAAWTAFHGSAR